MTYKRRPSVSFSRQWWLTVVGMSVGMVLIGVGFVLDLKEANASIGSLASFYIACLLLICTVCRLRCGSFFGLVSFTFVFGFLIKWLLHGSAKDVYREPIGVFDGGFAEWSKVLIFSAAGILGWCASAWIVGSSTENVRRRDHASLDLRKHWRVALYIFLIVLVVVVNLLNLRWEFYKVGYRPGIALPGIVSVVMSWLLIIGTHLLILCLMLWEKRRTGYVPIFLLLLLLFEATFSSFSSLSRSMFLVKTGPPIIWLVFFADYEWRRRWVKVGVLPAWVILFAATLAVVTYGRFRAQMVQWEATYVATVTAPSTEEPEEKEEDAVEITENQSEPVVEKTAHQVEVEQYVWKHRILEVGYLVVDRWLGLEAVMAVTSDSENSWRRFSQVVLNEPSDGAKTLYQRVSGSAYAESERTIFLTLPGLVGICCFCGSPVGVAVLMLIIGTVVISLERLIWSLTQNEILVIGLSGSVAYTFSQVNFPYLLAIYCSQLVVACLGVWLFEKIVFERSANRTPSKSLQPV